MNKLQSDILSLSKARPAFFILALFLIIGMIYAVWPQVGNQSVAISRLELQSSAVNFSVTQALPKQLNLDADKIQLGKSLFHDARLSVNNTVSCANCHSLSSGGVDNRARSVGVNGGLSVVTRQRYSIVV